MKKEVQSFLLKMTVVAFILGVISCLGALQTTDASALTSLTGAGLCFMGARGAYRLDLRLAKTPRRLYRKKAVLRTAPRPHTAHVA